MIARRRTEPTEVAGPWGPKTTSAVDVAGTMTSDADSPRSRTDGSRPLRWSFTRPLARLSSGRWASKSSLLIAWVVEILIFTAVEPGTFLRAATFRQLASSQAQLVILSLAVIPTLAVAEIDLSVASVMALTATLYGQLNGVDRWPTVPALVLCIAASALTGAISGFVTVFLNVRGIIVTLGMGTFVLGITSFISHSLTVGGISASLGNAVNYNIFGIRAAFFVALALAICIWYLLRHTPTGRSMLFLGFNREVARLSGIAEGRIRFFSFILGATIAGIAGIVAIGVAGGADPSSFQPYLLPSFAATFLGTLTFSPGRVHPIGNVVALYFLATGIYGIELLGVGNWINDAFYGGALVAIVALSGVVNKVGPVRRKATVQT